MGKRVFDFHHLPSWRETAWDICRGFLDDDVRRAFVRKPPEFVVSDDLSWLDRIIYDVTRRQADSKRLMAVGLHERYDDLRCCHATNTLDIARFYQEGLVPLDAHKVQARARAFFLNGQFPKLTPDILEGAIAEASRHLHVRKGYVFFEVNERMLVEQCGHYLLYGGGEYMIAIAASIIGAGSRDYRQALRCLGRPTVFLCDLPLTALENGIIEAAGIVLATIFEELLVSDGYEPDPYRGFGFCIPKALPPKRIVGHYHPIGVQDPFARHR